jgi:bacterial/archaeal transporter family protein
VTAVRTSVIVAFTWLLAWFTRQPNTSRLFNGKTWLHLGLSGISTGLAWLCYFQALSVGPPSRVAPFDELSIALVIVSALLLGEGLPWGQGRARALFVGPSDCDPLG